MANIYFATNRNPNRKRDPTDFGGQFHPDSPDCLRFGKAVVTGKTIKSIDVAPETLDKNPAKAKLGSQSVFTSLKRSMQAGADTLCFIHGYNVSFREALLTGGRLATAYRRSQGLNVVVFSWPSDGSMLPFLAYKRDRTDAATSAPALARAFMKLCDFLDQVRRGNECGARLHLMAHSMGNYVLRGGLQELRRLQGGVPRLFDQVLLLAADEDHDSFEHDHKFGPLPQLGASVSVYFNDGDTALVVSDRTKSNPTRLGNRGPRSPLTVPGNVSLVDVGEVVHGLVEHDYFHANRETVRDIAAVLRGQAQDQVKHRRYVAAQNRYVLLG